MQIQLLICKKCLSIAIFSRHCLNSLVFIYYHFSFGGLKGMRNIFIPSHPIYLSIRPPALHLFEILFSIYAILVFVSSCFTIHSFNILASDQRDIFLIPVFFVFQKLTSSIVDLMSHLDIKKPFNFQIQIHEPQLHLYKLGLSRNRTEKSNVSEMET